MQMRVARSQDIFAFDTRAAAYFRAIFFFFFSPLFAAAAHNARRHLHAAARAFSFCRSVRAHAICCLCCCLCCHADYAAAIACRLISQRFAPCECCLSATFAITPRSRHTLPCRHAAACFRHMMNSHHFLLRFSACHFAIRITQNNGVTTYLCGFCLRCVMPRCDVITVFSLMPVISPHDAHVSFRPIRRH